MAVFAASDQRCAKYIVATVYDQTRACPQLEDSQDYSGVIHGMSADSELTDAPLRPTRRSMGQDQGGIARPGGTCWGHRQGQPAVCRGGSLSLSRRNSLAGPAGTFWRSDQDTHAVFTLGQERRVEENV